MCFWTVSIVLDSIQLGYHYVSETGSVCFAVASFSVFLILYTVGRTPWTGDQPVARPLPKHRIPQTQNKRTQTYMPPVGFEPTITVLERAKTVLALDLAATRSTSAVHKAHNEHHRSIYLHIFSASHDLDILPSRVW
jgi:hypothetical protein